MSTAHIDTDTIEPATLSAETSRQASPQHDEGLLDDSVSDNEFEQEDEPIIINGDGTTVPPDALSTTNQNNESDEAELEDGDDDAAGASLSEDGDPVCAHKKGKEDPHQNDLREGCKKANGIPLCDLTRRCKHCLHLNPDEFQRIIMNKRDLNAKKLDVRRHKQHSQ